jgi:MFS family permease
MAQIVSELGDWFYSIAIFSFLLQVAGTAQSVSLAFMMQVLPQALTAPAAGVINDRISRRKVMLFADWTRAVIVAMMLLVQSRDSIWLLYVLLFCETVMWAMFEPAHNAVVPNITSGAEMMAANALSSTTWSFNFAIGSALGGIVAAIWGRQTVFVLNSLSFVVSALLIRRMKFDEPHVENLPRLRARDLTDFRPIFEGIQYVRKDARLAATIFVKTGLSLLGSNWVLLPMMGEKIFPVRLSGFDQRQAATMGMSILLGSRGVGALVGAFTGARITGAVQSRLRAAITFGFLLGGIGYVCLSRANTLWVACLTLIAAHAGGSVIWTSSTVLLQDMTDDRFRGRVFSAEFAFSMLTLAAVSTLGGYLLDHGVSIRAMALWTGILFVIPAVVWIYVQRRWQPV